MKFHVFIVAFFMPLGSNAFLLKASQAQRNLETTKPAHNSSLGSLTAPRRLRGASKNAGKQSQRPPRVYFLFLAVDKISNWGVWTAFFKEAPLDKFRALIHCKGSICKLFASKSKPLKLVPTVDGSYCANLVAPMNQLLASALQDQPWSTNPKDKFVFVSDNTLPAKPFWHIYNTLTSRIGSDFCVFPSKDWADVPAKIFVNGEPRSGGHELAIKTHQWMVLSRTHTERAVHLWKQGVMLDMMTHFHLNQNTAWQAPGNRSFGDNRNFGCLDEFWHMYVLFGPWTITDVQGSTEYHYTDLTNAPLRINPKAGWQGACDTFALWSEYTTASFHQPPGSNSTVSPWVKLYSSLDQSSIPHISGSRPAWWDTISRDGIRAIHNSDFLFVRKFHDNPTLAYGGDFAMEYSKIILAT